MAGARDPTDTGAMVGGLLEQTMCKAMRMPVGGLGLFSHRRFPSA